MGVSEGVVRFDGFCTEYASRHADGLMCDPFVICAVHAEMIRSSIN